MELAHQPALGSSSSEGEAGGQGAKKCGIMASMMPENFQDWQRKIKFRRRRRRNLEKFRFLSQKMAIFGKKWPKNAIKTQNIGYIGCFSAPKAAKNFGGIYRVGKGIYRVLSEKKGYIGLGIYRVSKSKIVRFSISANQREETHEFSKNKYVLKIFYKLKFINFVI